MTHKQPSFQTYPPYKQTWTGRWRPDVVEKPSELIQDTLGDAGLVRVETVHKHFRV